MTVRICLSQPLCVLFWRATAFGQDMAEMYAQGYRLDTELKSRSAPIMPSLRWQRNVTFAEALHRSKRKIHHQLGLDLLHPADAVAKPRPLVLFVHGGGWASGNRSMVKASCPCSPVAGLWRGRCRTVFLEMLPTPQRCRRCGRRGGLDSNQRGVTRGGSRPNCHMGSFSRGPSGHPHCCF